MLQWLASLFSSDKIGDTVLDYLRDKTGLNDLTERERLEHEAKRIEMLTEYQRATRHQSPMRRFIAFCFTSLAVLFVLAWLVIQSVGTLADLQEYVYMAARIKNFYTDVLLMPTSLVLAFYFGTGTVNSLKANNNGK